MNAEQIFVDALAREPIADELRDIRLMGWMLTPAGFAVEDPSNAPFIAPWGWIWARLSQPADGLVAFTAAGQSITAQNQPRIEKIEATAKDLPAKINHRAIAAGIAQSMPPFVVHNRIDAGVFKTAMRDSLSLIWVSARSRLRRPGRIRRLVLQRAARVRRSRAADGAAGRGTSPSAATDRSIDDPRTGLTKDPLDALQRAKGGKDIRLRQSAAFDEFGHPHIMPKCPPSTTSFMSYENRPRVEIRALDLPMRNHEDPQFPWLTIDANQVPGCFAYF